MTKSKSDINKIDESEVHCQSLKEREEERLCKDIFRSDMEKFRLFTKMLRNTALLNRAVITHK